MPIKDAARCFRCKYCGKEFTLFENSKGKLIFYPENVMWPVHGDLELIDHLRSKHTDEYEYARIFFTERMDVIDYSYDRVREEMHAIAG